MRQISVKKRKKEWKDALKRAFEAPAPLDKAEFLQKMAPPRPYPWSFLFIQLRYIRKRIWVFSVLLFTAALFSSFALSADTLWGISAFTPLLALLTVAETGRSERYEMAELEMSTCFSTKSVLLARLGILGFGNLLLLGLLFPVCLFHNPTPPLQAGLYIVTPFLLTAFLCLYIVRRHRERENIYLCTGAAACISFSASGLRLALPWLYGENALIGWGFVAAVSAVCMVKQYQNLIFQEELTWNLS